MDAILRILRSNTPGAIPPDFTLEPGQIAINQHDERLFAPDPTGATVIYDLSLLATIPGLLQSLSALMMVVHVVPIGITQSYPFDVRTKHALVFGWGGGAGSAGPANPGGSGGTTTIDTVTAGVLTAGGGVAAVIGDAPQPSRHGGASGGDLNFPGLGAAGGLPGTGNGGLVIKFYPVTASVINFTIGAGGAASGDGGLAGFPGAAFLLELT